MGWKWKTGIYTRPLGSTLIDAQWKRVTVVRLPRRRSSWSAHVHGRGFT